MLLDFFKQIFTSPDRTPKTKGRFMTAAGKAGENSKLIGKIGYAATKLRMSGLVEIEGKPFEAITKKHWVDRNAVIRVVGIKFGCLEVEAC